MASVTGSSHSQAAASRIQCPCLRRNHLFGSYVDLLDESKFEVYETVGWVAVQESFKSRSVLELREIEEQL